MKIRRKTSKNHPKKEVKIKKKTSTNRSEKRLILGGSARRAREYPGSDKTT